VIPIPVFYWVWAGLGLFTVFLGIVTYRRRRIYGGVTFLWFIATMLSAMAWAFLLFLEERAASGI
jgi:hypothetical protein